jgi:hypothetical protein
LWSFPPVYGAKIATRTQRPEPKIGCSVLAHTLIHTSHLPQSLKRRAGILSSPHLRELWYEDLQVMSGRIARMRRLLYDGLVAAGTPSPSGSWEHIISQIGMFAFTGLTVRIPSVHAT